MNKSKLKRLVYLIITVIAVCALVVELYYTQVYHQAIGSPEKNRITKDKKPTEFTTANTQIKTNTDEKNGTSNNAKSTVKVALFYTLWWGEERNWETVLAGINAKTLMFQKYDGKPCKYKCRLTYDRNELDVSDAVIFHGNDIPGNIHELSRNRKNYKQRWVYHSMENPYNEFRVSAENLNGIFNWTITVRTDSDAVTQYNQYRELTPDEVSKVKQDVNHAQGRSNLVTWSVSHCDTRGRRDEVVQKLTKFLPILINGKCAERFPNRKNVASCGGRSSPQCAQLYKTTKFYLAFENGVCPDYITEKYWINALSNGMVPIVFGLKETYQKLAIPGSYINLFDFPSIEALADYIKYLDKNDTAYNEYFEWKSKYKVVQIDICDFCTSLHNSSLPPKIYNDLGSFYGTVICDRNLPLVNRYLT